MRTDANCTTKAGFSGRSCLMPSAILTLILLLAASQLTWAQALHLQKPGMAGASFLEDEAGITAYMNTGQAVDLSLARKAYRTIEEETDQYVIGSVEISGYPETEDVHTYVNKDGWIVAYYLKQEATAKIIDWNDYFETQTIRRTKLEVAIQEIANTAFVQVTEIKYYHFAYPSANRLLIAMDAMWHKETEDSFDIKLPGGFTFYERSYLHFSRVGGVTVTTQLYVNQIEMSRHAGMFYSESWSYGILTPLQLPTDMFHTIKIAANRQLPTDSGVFGAIVLIYKTS